MQIHYQGWASKYDALINLSDSKCFPLGYRVPVKNMKKVKSNVCKAVTVTENEFNEEFSDEFSDNLVNSSMKDGDFAQGHVETTRSGRPVRSTFINIDKPVIRKKRSDWDNSDSKNDNRKVYNKDAPDYNEWVCGLCGLLDCNDGSLLILCDGPCKRSFHTGCLNLSKRKLDQVLFRKTTCVV